MNKHKTFSFYLTLLIFLSNLNFSYGQTPDGGLPAGVIKRFKHGHSVYSVDISPNGELLASGGENNSVILWNVSDGSKRKVFTGPSESVMSVVFSPDGKLLASASLDGFIRLYDVKTEKSLKSFSHGGWVKALAFSPDGNTLASGGEDHDGTVKWWDVSVLNSSPIKTFPGHNKTVESVIFSTDKRMFATASRDRTAKLWDIQSQQMHKNLTKHVNVVCAAAFSPDGKLLATSSRENSIILWNVSSGGNITEFKIQGGTYVYAEDLTFSPNGKYIALACKDETIRIWDVVERKQTLTMRGHRGAVTSVKFSRDGRRLVSGSRDRTVLLWDLSHFNIVQHEPIPDPNPSPDHPVVLDIDTTPPNISILSPTGRVVPPETEQLPIRGQITDENGIGVVKVNDREVWISANGVFATTIPLSGGDNEIRVNATDIYENIGTKRFTVERPVPIDTEPPVIILDKNVETDLTHQNAEFTVQGYVTDNNGVDEVKVNDEIVPVSVEGGFAVDVPLKKGENVIRVTATDIQGNMDTASSTIIRQNLGPKINILEHELGLTRGLKRIIVIKEANTEIVFEVKDEDGISEVTVNGKRVLVREKDFKTRESLNERVSLNYGDNSIHITATDSLGALSEKRILIHRPPQERKDYALLFAVEDYVHWCDLRYPISDADKVKNHLKNIYGFETELIKNPTKAEIIRAIRKYAEKIYDDDDQLLIFFAGHGYFDETLREGYLVARDSTGPIQNNMIQNAVSHFWVSGISNRMDCKHIFLVMDTCYSGTFDDELVMRGIAKHGSKQLTRGYINQIPEYTTRRYLTSGKIEQVPDKSKFIEAFLSALESKGGEDKILSIKEILSYMNHLENPTPHAGGFGQDESGSDFLFFAK